MFGKRSLESEQSEDSTPANVKKSPGFFQRVRQYFTSLLVLALIAFFCVPWIASSLLTQETAEEWLSESLPANIKIGNASVGWISPVLLNDVVIEDDLGNKLADVKAITSNQTMLDLLKTRSQHLELEFEGMVAKFIVPKLQAAEASGNSIDVEAVLQKFFKQNLSQPTQAMTIRIVQSELTLTNDEGRTLAKWHPINATYESNRSLDSKQKLTIDAPVASFASENSPAVKSQGKLGLIADWTGASSQDSKESLKLTLDCSQQPLEVLQPLVETYFPDLLPEEPASFQIGGIVERVGNEELFFKLDTQFTDHKNSLTPQSPLEFDVEASYSQEKNSIDVPRLFAQVKDSSVDLKAEVSDVSGKQIVDAKGQFKSPAEGLSKLLPEGLKKNVHFKEIDVSDLSIKGPLRPDPAKPFDIKFEISTNVSWKDATAFGLKSDEGRVKLSMLGNEVVLTPINVPVGGGHVHQLPSFDLSTQPITVTVDKGLTLEKITLTEEICNEWLRYLSPLLSEATRPSGTFSLIADAGNFQLEKMNEANLSGKLNIHQAQVRPGALADQLIGMVSAVFAARGKKLNGKDGIVFLEMENQTVEYQVVDGRVYHAGFNFNVGDVKFSSNGSVGFDETLDIVVAMQLPDSLADRGPVLRALQDVSMNFKVTGTMDKPVIQGDRLKDVGKQIGINAAEGLLERILERRNNRRSRKDR